VANNSLWDEVARAAAAGKRPKIEIAPGARVIVPKRGRGRPKKVDAQGKRTYYAMTTADGIPMRCRNYGCNLKLRVDQVAICCSPRCEEALRDFCQTTLDVLSGKMSPKDYPSYYRARSGRAKTARPKKQRK
jgi:hypothetical protein